MSKVYFESYRDLAVVVQAVLSTADIDVTDDGQLIIYTNLMARDDHAIVEWTDSEEES